jgi:hypothetical protein
MKPIAYYTGELVGFAISNEALASAWLVATLVPRSRCWAAFAWPFFVGRN